MVDAGQEGTLQLVNSAACCKVAWECLYAEGVISAVSMKVVSVLTTNDSFISSVDLFFSFLLTAFHTGKLLWWCGRQKRTSVRTPCCFLFPPAKHQLS